MWFALLVSAAVAGSLKPPKDSIALVVEDVAPTSSADLLFLVHPERAELVPIPIGETEAFTIAHRLGNRSPERPLTHDLLDQVMRNLGAVPVQVHVHTRSGTHFHARITLQVTGKRRRLLHLDAQASDAAAIAAGHGLPLYMSRDVYDESKMTVDAMIESLTTASATRN